VCHDITGIGFQVIIRFCLSNINGPNAGITDGMDLMKYTVEMGSGSLMYIPSFKNCFSLSKDNGGVNIHTAR
jgi:hypothetical protein